MSFIEEPFEKELADYISMIDDLLALDNSDVNQYTNELEGLKELLFVMKVKYEGTNLGKQP